MSAEGNGARAEVRTDPHDPDPELRGRTYAIPFDRVWNAAVALAGGDLGRWRLIAADDREGVITAERKGFPKRVTVVRIDVGLDENAQTRVDLRARPAEGHGDFGGARRSVRGFVRGLDARLGALPAQVLDVNVVASRSS
jgi:hypothetical protein